MAFVVLFGSILCSVPDTLSSKFVTKDAEDDYVWKRIDHRFQSSFDLASMASIRHGRQVVDAREEHVAYSLCCPGIVATYIAVMPRISSLAGTVQRIFIRGK